MTFEGNTQVTYDATVLDEIVLAYAATIHKSQGSEYRIVVAPLLNQHSVMLQRNLLYTCITRAREILVLVGSRQAIARAVANNKPQSRNSLLRAKLRMPKNLALMSVNGPPIDYLNEEWPRPEEEVPF